MLQFTDAEALARYNNLKDKPFASCYFIDWEVLRSIGLDCDVQEFISTGAWPIFFEIHDEAYRELTLEVLSTFTINGKHRGMDIPGLIEFRVGGRWHHLSYTQFSVHMGLYTEEFVSSPAYRQLATCFPRRESMSAYWWQVSRGPEYAPTRSKGSTLRSPVLRYMHRLLAQSINARRDSPGVVGEHDLFYLYSMRERYPIHLGYAVANFIMGQAQRRKTAALYAGHFITHLVRGMGFLSELSPMELMWRMAPLGISTLTAMHMIQRDRRAGMQGYVLVGG